MITAIIQARVSSTRLPGKVLADIVGKPLLSHVIERVKASRILEEIVVATTAKEVDKAILKIATESGVHSFAGDEDDVLDRYYQAARKFDVDIIVRITADCPLLDPNVVDKVVRHYLEGGCDYVSTTLKRTYPDGLDVEVFSSQALKKAWKEARWASEREHVTPYIWKNPDKFRLASVESKVNLSHLRWTVDIERDLRFVREVYGQLYKRGKIFYMEDILQLLERQPELIAINQGIATNEGYAKSLREDRLVE